jgi:hypothetical protein
MIGGHLNGRRDASSLYKSVFVRLRSSEIVFGTEPNSLLSSHLSSLLSKVGVYVVPYLSTVFEPCT